MKVTFAPRGLGAGGGWVVDGRICRLVDQLGCLLLGHVGRCVEQLEGGLVAGWWHIACGIGTLAYRAMEI